MRPYEAGGCKAQTKAIGVFLPEGESYRRLAEVVLEFPVDAYDSRLRLTRSLSKAWPGSVGVSAITRSG